MRDPARPGVRPSRIRRESTAALLAAAACIALAPIGCGHARFERRLALLELEADRQAVIELIHRYAHGLDHGDDALLAETFAPDAVAEYVGANYPLNVRLEGLPAILDWLHATRQHRAAPWHYMDTHLVEVEGDRGTLRTYQHNRNLSGIGLYTEEAVRTPGGWRIAKLHLEQRILDPEMLEEAKSPAGQQRIQR